MRSEKQVREKRRVRMYEWVVSEGRWRVLT